MLSEQALGLDPSHQDSFGAAAVTIAISCCHHQCHWYIHQISLALATAVDQ